MRSLLASSLRLSLGIPLSVLRFDGQYWTRSSANYLIRFGARHVASETFAGFCADDDEICLRVLRDAKDFVGWLSPLDPKQGQAVQLHSRGNQLLQLMNDCRRFVRVLLHMQHREL